MPTSVLVTETRLRLGGPPDEMKARRSMLVSGKCPPRGFLFLLGLLVLPACGGYDAEYDCEQTVACAELMTGQSISRAAIEGCIERSEAFYDDVDEDTQDYMDEASDTCGDEKACRYVVCVCDFLYLVNDPGCAEARKHI